MRLSHNLCKQHIGWHFKKFWEGQGRRNVIKTEAAAVLKQKSIPIFKPEDILQEKQEFTKIDVVGYKPKPIPLDETHPNWHNRPLLTYKDSNVLLEGLVQAKILTKTIEVKEGLPEQLRLNSTEKLDGKVKEIILGAHVFDAEQQKLPKLKDPNRPAWNFPRAYGITQERTNKLLLTNLLQLIENHSDLNIVRQRYLFDNVQFLYNFEKYDDLIQFDLKSDSFLTSSKPLTPVTNLNTEELELPNIFPIKPTITLSKENIYVAETKYPINLKISKCHPHTLFVHHIETEVQNLFEEEVTETQIFGRSLLKAFAAAASYAKEKHGNKKLPSPVTVQCVQTNGRLFHFGVLQLNTLDTEENGVKNIWYQTGRIPLFEFCGYKTGRPVLEGYNSEVIKYLNAFYQNS